MCLPSPPCDSVASSVGAWAGLAHLALHSDPVVKLDHTGNGLFITSPLLAPTQSHSLSLAFTHPLLQSLSFSPRSFPSLPSSLCSSLSSFPFSLCFFSLLTLSSLPPPIPSLSFLLTEWPLCANPELGTDASEVGPTASSGSGGFSLRHKAWEQQG